MKVAQYVKVKGVPGYSKRYDGWTGRILGCPIKGRIRVLLGESQIWFDLKELEFLPELPEDEEAA
jgi:hypothetical protein